MFYLPCKYYFPIITFWADEHGLLCSPLNQEEMAELKAQLYLLEKEKKALELKLNSREAQEQAYLVHIEHLKSEVEEQKEQRMRSLSSASSSSKDKSSKVR